MTIKKISSATKTASGIKVPVKKTTVKKAGSPAKPAAKPAVNEPFKIPASAAAKHAVKKIKKEHKEKIVRDSFTMPHSEYQKIAEIKEACLKAGMHVKKSEVLRAGLKALCEKNDAQLKQSLRSLEKIQTGRPKKH
jgi:hypothetical protein